MGGGGSWNPVNIIEDAVSSVGDVLASVDPGPAIGGALAEVDDFVNDEIPGGWALPAAIAVAYMTGYVDPSLFGEAAFTGATETGLATLAGEGALADTIGTTLLSGTLEGATAAGQAAYAEALASGLSEAEALAAADAASTTYFQGGSNFAGLTPEYAAELGLEGSSGLGIEGMAGDPLAGLEGLEETFTPEYPGDSQYEVQDLQEQARATDVKPGSPTSWDTGESLIPQELKDAANAINKARQVYNLGNSLLGGSGAGTGMRTGMYMPYSGFDAFGGTGGTTDLTGGIKNLTPGLTAANQNYTLSGMPDIDETVSPVHFEDGGSVDPYAVDQTISKSKLTPSLTKAQLNYILTGLPGNLISKAEGGSIQENNPEDYSIYCSENNQ